MPASRVEVIDNSPFNPREWLRREVLWASLIAPYGAQISAWLNESAVQQHNSNVSRRDLFGRDESPEFQSQSFFNQGKNVSGIISSATLFKACMTSSGEGAQVNMLRVQADIVDKVLGNLAAGSVAKVSDTSAYATCGQLARRVFMPARSAESPRVKPGTKQILLHAHRLMVSLASFEAGEWIAASFQNEDNSLPNLEINNGGHARSAGPRVEMLQSILHKIVEFEEYKALS